MSRPILREIIGHTRAVLGFQNGGPVGAPFQRGSHTLRCAHLAPILDISEVEIKYTVLGCMGES